VNYVTFKKDYVMIPTVIKAYLGAMQFLKENLSAYNYSWINETIFTGNPSRRLFNRYNGNQLLFIINLYASTTEEFTVNSGLRIEDMLMNQLPVDAKSEITVLKWLNQATLLPVGTFQ
jgi:hypothetical protein